MSKARNRRRETIAYVTIWLIAVALYLLNIMQARVSLNLSPLTPAVLGNMALTMMPFLLLFLVNNNLLIPRLLLRNRWGPYLMAAAGVIVLLWVWQYFQFMHEEATRPRGGAPFPHPHMRPLIPMPLFIDLTYSLLVVGCNLAVALTFQRIDDRLERESLMKANAENQLAYLRAQINPHFYMNMLNNIHGMIEIDPEKAQAMVIDMSQLMRYSLYDSSRPLISLADEVAFLQNYLRLMRQRYPENKVTITSSFPAPELTKGISIPPLLTLVFVENAFKHGISYLADSFVSVAIELTGKNLRFSCLNSNHPGKDKDREPSGIGLRNVSQRLQLLYGDRASLSLDDTTSTYSVTLTIPIHAAENTDY